MAGRKEADTGKSVKRVESDFKDYNNVDKNSMLTKCTVLNSSSKQES